MLAVSLWSDQMTLAIQYLLAICTQIFRIFPTPIPHLAMQGIGNVF